MAKMMSLLTGEKTMLTNPTVKKRFSSKLPRLTADGNTIMNLPCLTRLLINFYQDILHPVLRFLWIRLTRKLVWVNNQGCIKDTGIVQK
jgi:hypothetical protein